MCLIALAHRATERFPLVLAANRDEDHERPSIAADFWSDHPEVLGGRDAVLGGTWLAINRHARFAAVTNLRGAVRRSKSRGFLVSDFVTRGELPADVSEYAGFHLIAGEAGGEVAYVTPEQQSVLAPGVYGFSNAPLGETWPKTDIAIRAMRDALRIVDVDELAAALMQFLQTPRGTSDPMREIFVEGERYGTRASTVLIVSHNEIFFTEQTFLRGGIAQENPRQFRFAIGS